MIINRGVYEMILTLVPSFSFSVPAIQSALKEYGEIPNVKFAGLYDLRLKISIDHSLYHLQEPLYTVMVKEGLSGIEKKFAYVDPRNEVVQKEMEMVFTDYLKKIGAYLPPDRLREVEQTPKSFPVEASVVIPVRNRKETIAEAVKSALSQETDFSFNSSLWTTIPQMGQQLSSLILQGTIPN